ncbi:MAG: DUF4190 domain-containing protein [Tissierellia bacterium]|nr:DUF4190 domain-containing protein [Tissierellia bacterium]
MGIAALVLGIFSVMFAFFGGIFGWVGSILGIIGIVLAVVGRKNPEQKGMATAGLVLSIIGTILGFVMVLACAACVGALDSM